MIVARVAPEMIEVAGEETTAMTMTTIMATIMTTTTTIRTRPVTVVGR
jgi:hypothetical protein